MKDRLKELRKALGITQRELAERLGLVVGNVCSWETGFRAVPRARVYQICKEFNVRREWLERGEGEMFEPGQADVRVVQKELQKELVSKCIAALPEDARELVFESLREYIDVPER